MNYCYLGSEYKIAKSLSSLGRLKAIVCESRSFNHDLYDYAVNNAIPFFSVSNTSELDTAFERIEGCDTGISYGIGIIFKKRHIDIFKNGIWNIHPGRLPQNRGRHPIAWSFINNCSEFWVTIHVVSEEIDMGYRLAEGFVSREITDDTPIVTDKLVDFVCDKLLKRAVTAYENNDLVLLDEGTYNESMVGKFQNIDPDNSSGYFIFNLMKSQSCFNGVVIDGVRYHECHYFNNDVPSKYEGYRIIKCFDGIDLAVK